MNPRPKINDKEVIDKIAEKLFPQLVVWLSSSDGTDYTDEENKTELMDQIKEIITDSSTTDDGYRIARNFEQEGWDPDAQLVEILDHTSTYARNALRDLCTIWWAEQKIQFYPDGTKVKVLPTCRNDAKGHIGTVVGNHADGRYTVNISKMGHVQPGGSGTTGIILEHELVEVVI
jgi:hypothetical protein